MPIPNESKQPGKTTVSVLHDAQLLLNKQQQIWVASILYIHWHFSRSTDTVSIQLTGQLADKPTRSQSTRGLDNSRTGQLADSEFLKMMELLYFFL